MLCDRTSLNLLKGKFEGGKTGLSSIVTAVRSHFGFCLLKGMGAITLPHFFSRENLNVVNRTIFHSDCSAITFWVLSPQGDGGDRTL
ncbi:hypothetical protein [Cylindrospermopsis raciborskii]|uniref:hypothetical protein n=1 Tax=Cylindrospermopsis raciborskii TaxID=77022 RepID=UPI0011783C39|nr:hypothetical protein [Cylindrospermopsis raciborskii]